MNPTTPSVLKYPGLQETGSSAARSAQKKHFQLVTADLVLLTLAAATSASSCVVSPEGSRFDVMLLLTVLFLISGLFVAIIVRTHRFDRRWFAARAVAESVKTEAWRYMMGVAPYPLGGDEAAHDKLFLDAMKKIGDSQPEALAELAGHHSDTPWLPPEMRAVRKLSLDERTSFYLERRLREQWTWYKGQAQVKNAADQFWSWVGLGIHGIAVALGLVALVFTKVSSGWIGLLTTVAASFIAWNQSQSHQQLAQSYTLAAQQLAALASSQTPSREDALAVLVEETERAISREHSMWLTRRA